MHTLILKCISAGSQTQKEVFTVISNFGSSENTKRAHKSFRDKKRESFKAQQVLRNIVFLFILVSDGFKILLFNISLIFILFNIKVKMSAPVKKIFSKYFPYTFNTCEHSLISI